jgi:hypothetical protein
LPQIAARLRGARVSEVHVISPLYAHVEVGAESGLALDTLRHLAAEWPKAKVCVYTQFDDPDAASVIEGSRTFNYRAGIPEISDEEEDESDETESAPPRGRPGRLHAKAYMFVEHGGSGHLFVGSANLTAPALRMAPPRGGNVELLWHRRLSKKTTSAITTSLQEELFREVARGRAVKPAEPHRAPAAPVAQILGGWQVGSTVVLDLCGPAAGSVRVAAARDGKALAVGRRGDKRIELTATAAVALGVSEKLSGPVVLWEKVGGAAFPFIVNPTLVASADGAVDAADIVESLLYELECRLPPLSRAVPPPTDPDDAAEDEPEDERDPWAKLTHTEFQGELDKIALLAARLRRLLARHPAARSSILRLLGASKVTAEMRRVLALVELEVPTR